jgi:hypothetical protein
VHDQPGHSRAAAPVLQIRIAALLFWATAIGFSASIVPVALYLLEHRDLPQVFGIRAFSGPFEALGVETFVVLLAAFQVVCVLEATTGWLIWTGRRGGGVLGLALLPIAAIFWVGFALPLPPLIGLVRAAIVIANWRLLHSH